MRTYCKLLLIIALFYSGIHLFSQNMMSLIPINTATHIAVQSGDWFSNSTWNTGTVPSDAAIVVIPNGISVNYEGQSNAHIFAIRVDGNFTCKQSNINQTTTLTFDTFIGLENSIVKFLGNNASDGKIDITITPFDIEAHKSGASGFPQTWNNDAKNHFSDGKTAYEVTRTYDTSGPRLYTYADAIAAGSPLTGSSSIVYDDGIGVIGRYDWDPGQVSIGIALMGQIEILGQEKLNMVKLNADALKSQKSIELASSPTGWKVGDKIIVTSGGNYGANSNGEDEAEIASISGNTIITQSNLLKNHEGKPAEDLHCYVGNLTRNITFKSGDISSVHHRAHFMTMMNDTNVQIKNAAFVDMGRTDKSKLTDDFIWSKWLEPKTFKSYITALGQESVEAVKNPANEIINSRGRYSIHLHKVGSNSTSNMAYVTGNVVWGNPGWGITHHDSYATVSENVVYDVVGSGIVSESGNELGFWDNNLVVKIEKGHTTDPYDAALIFDDYLYSGEGLGMKGRGVICRGNVIANANRGVGVMNMNPVVNNQMRMDATALATLRTGYNVDNFPLDVNGYSKEEDGVMPVEVALILENTTVINSYQGLRSIERDMGVNSETRSIFDGFKAWGVNQGIQITYQADYSFNDVYVSGKNTSSLGIDLWKHSHNQTFNKVKLEDLGYGIQVSKLVGENNGPFKTRNNGFTPWVFVDLTTSNVTQFYKIIKESESATANYSEHGDNTIHLSSSEIDSRPTTFTVLDSTQLSIDYGGNDFRFEIDGIITDDYGSYDMGIKQAWAQGTLRVDYPERIYEFASQAKFDEYIANNGVYKDEKTEELYFILKENLPNRLTNLYTEFPVRINILNPPVSGDYASPQSESKLDLAPKNYMLSRFSTVSQSSEAILNFDGTSITAEAEKAIDGNNNGRLNVQLFQRGLVPVGSLSSTNTESEPWFDMDLGETKIINYIDIWNSVQLNGTDIETPSTHFKNFYVLISDQPFGNSTLADSRNHADFEYLKDGLSTRKFSLNNLGVEGQYIRIQAIGTNKLEFAEIEVIGKNITSGGSLSKDKDALASIKIYPNPSNGRINLDLGKIHKNVSVEISNVLGQTVYHKNLNNFRNGQIVFEGSTGVYLMRISSSNIGSKTYKLLKK